MKLFVNKGDSLKFKQSLESYNVGFKGGAPSFYFFPLSFEGEGDTGGEVG